MRYLIVFIFLCSSNSFAARPMLTDDARITTPKGCQLEAWTKINKDSNELWALPACNFTDNLEITIGGAKNFDNKETTTSDVVYQAKTLFRKLETNSWGYGLVLGNVRHPAINTDTNAIGDLYTYIPASYSFSNDNYIIHTNIGAIHSKQDKETNLTWGLGTEIKINESTYFIGETFGQNKNNPLYQVGVRYWAIKDTLQFDTTYGNRFGNNTEERWFSFGIRVLSAPFLP